MKSLLLSLAVLIAVVVADVDYKQLESIDVPSFLNDENKRKTLFKCPMDEIPCGELQNLRDAVPVLVQTKCSECSPELKKKYDETNKLLLTRYPKEYNAIYNKY